MAPNNHSLVRSAPNLENNDLGQESDIDMEEIEGISSDVLSTFQDIDKESGINDSLTQTKMHRNQWNVQRHHQNSVDIYLWSQT